MKRVLILLLALLLLAGCQPTPEADVVMNKTEGRLEELIVAAPKASAAPERTVRERVGAPGMRSRWTRILRFWHR